VLYREDTRTCRICSRSSANASATDAIQNCLNRFRRACSSWARLLDPCGGRNGGGSAGGGEGEGDRRRWSWVLAGSESVRCGIAGEDAGCVTGASLSSSSSSPPSESDDEDEDEDKDGDGAGLVACGFIRGTLLTGVFSGTSDSSDEESEESDDDDDEAWRRLRFLLRLGGAVGLAAGI
jgi:hypothetical protein